MPRSFSPSQNRFPPPPPPPPPPRSRSSSTTTQSTRQSKNNRSSSVANQKEGQAHTHKHKQHSSTQHTTLIDKDKETWEEVELNDSIIWSSSESNDESDDYIHESALEISKHLQSMHHESVNSFHGMLRKTSIGTESLKDDKSIGALINNLQESNSQEKGHMESIIGILERNNEVAQSADKIIEIFEMAQQIVRNNDSIIISCCDNGGDDYHCDEEDDDYSRSDSSSNISSSINVMEKKPAQGMKVTNRKSQLLPPPPRPRSGPQQFNKPDQEKQTQKQKQKRQQKQKRSKGKASVEDNDSVVADSVLVIADRLTKASVIDEPSVIEGPDDDEYWQGHNKEKSKKGNGRVYKQIGGDELYVGHEETKQSRVHEKAPNTDNCGRKMSKQTRRRSLDRQKRELNEFRKQKQEERRRKKPTATRSYSCPMQTDKKSIVDRLVKKRTQMSMVSNTTESTAQSTPSLLGHQINIRSSMSSGSNRSERRRSRSNASVASDSSNSSRSPVSKTSSRKSSFSRKSRLSRASSRYDDESFESESVEENRSPIFQLPSPPVDEISVCASSLSCRSGRSRRQPSESGASTTSCRSGRSLQKKQAPQRISKDQKDSSWKRMKSRFKNISKHM